MRSINTYIFILIGFLLNSGCAELDLNPLAEGSSESWYSNENQLNMALNDMYRKVFWARDFDEWTDDWTSRSTVTSITGGTLNGEDFLVTSRWANSYKAIARANTFLYSFDKASGVTQEQLETFEGEARFIRASQYAYLITHWGDVPFFTDYLDIEDALSLGRTSKDVIKEEIYSDFDIAIDFLPVSYNNSQIQRATKGAALAMKARAALYLGDFDVARDAAKACMDLEEYSLHPDFRTLSLASTKNSSEQILGFPNSVELSSFWDAGFIVKRYVPRNNGGFASYQPSWDLFCSFLCTDGLPIDESPLFDPRNPFENRDPRLGETMPVPGSNFLGFKYEPNPDSTQVFNFETEAYQLNKDSRRPDNLFASFNGLVWKKGIDESWIDLQADNDLIVIRYADVLLMYAESKIELGEIDQSVLDAINMVRARAYKVDYTDTGSYPAVTTTDVSELRSIVRVERRMEFAHEGLRYMDIIRWGIADEVLNTNIYGHLDYAELKDKVLDPDLWFLPGIPEIDENGTPNFDPLYDAGLIKQLAVRSFPERQYVWPIPSSEILINDNLNQEDY